MHMETIKQLFKKDLTTRKANLEKKTIIFKTHQNVLSTSIRAIIYIYIYIYVYIYIYIYIYIYNSAAYFENTFP